MFDKLIDFIINQINNIIPFKIVFQYHKGAKYWCGRFVGVLEPGIHFKFPYLHTIIIEQSVDTTLLLPTQSVIAINDENIVVRGVVGYRIIDMGKYFNNVYDTKSAISDNACLVLRQQCAAQTFEAIKDINLGKNLRKLLQKQVDDYGININFFGLIELTDCVSLKIFNENLRLES